VETVTRTAASSARTRELLSPRTVMTTSLMR
jgi:hypothetical protein